MVGRSCFVWAPLGWKRLGAGLIIMFCGGLICSPALAQEPRATPYRPTVSNPAYLPVPGYLEVELGWRTLKGKVADTYVHSVPYLLKFGFTDRVGVLVGGQAVNVLDRRDEPATTGTGDLFGLLKLAQPLNTSMPSALGLEVGANHATSPIALGSGDTDVLIKGIYSAAFGPLSLDLNVDYILNYVGLGAAPSDEGQDGLGWVTTVSCSVTDRMGVAGEFFGFYRKGIRPFLQYLSAVNYFITPRVVGDAGMAFGLTGASQEWTAFAGVTVLTWKLM